MNDGRDLNLERAAEKEASEAPEAAYETERKRLLLTYLGFAAKSKKAVFGTELTLKEICRVKRAKKSEIVAVLSSDASERTKKQVTDKCTFHNVFLVSGMATGAEISLAVGKKSGIASLAVTDRGLCAAIKKLCEKNNKPPAGD